MAGYRFSSFRDLKREKREGVHYSIRSEDRGSGILIMAPHGGAIEPHTAELAEEVAADDFSLFAFIGEQAQHNLYELHIESHRYDEECAIRMAREAEFVFALHGLHDDVSEFLLPGGLLATARDDLARVWASQGLEVRPAKPGLEGEHPNNICNLGRLGRGVQVELSSALRRRFRRDLASRTAFVDDTRDVLLALERELRA